MVEACAQLTALESAWLNHECATKYMAGYAFGTYLPPLYSDLSARVTADNLCFLQDQLDRQVRLQGGHTPLVLLEMPPLTYFACGSLPIADFFRMVIQRTPCGLVLDIGHLWTVYRYTGAWRQQSLQAFAAEFLEAFPLTGSWRSMSRALPQRRPGRDPDRSVSLHRHSGSMRMGLRFLMYCSTCWSRCWPILGWVFLREWHWKWIPNRSARS